MCQKQGSPPSRPPEWILSESWRPATPGPWRNCRPSKLSSTSPTPTSPTPATAAALRTSKRNEGEGSFANYTLCHKVLPRVPRSRGGIASSVSLFNEKANSIQLYVSLFVVAVNQHTAQRGAAAHMVWILAGSEATFWDVYLNVPAVLP